MCAEVLLFCMADPVEHLSMIARNYCAWVEAPPLPEEAEVKTALRLLADLSSAIMATPSLGCGEDIACERISGEEWGAIYKRFASLPFNYYLTLFSPAKLLEQEPVVGDLADDLADMYRDIKEGLWLFDHGHSVEAVWSWRDSFQTHWGRHATNALYVLHTWSADEGIEL